MPAARRRRFRWPEPRWPKSPKMAPSPPAPLSSARRNTAALTIVFPSRRLPNTPRPPPACRFGATARWPAATPLSTPAVTIIIACDYSFPRQSSISRSRRSARRSLFQRRNEAPACGPSWDTIARSYRRGCGALFTIACGRLLLPLHGAKGRSTSFIRPARPRRPPPPPPWRPPRAWATQDRGAAPHRSRQKPVPPGAAFFAPLSGLSAAMI